MPDRCRGQFLSLRLRLSTLGLAWALALVTSAGQAQPAPASAAPVQRERERERVALLEQGEAALAHGRSDQALRLFEKAAAMAHTADTELALVRTHLQTGAYQQAIAFSAHTAGAHRQVPEGAALYAWLLAIGGQREAADKLLDAADERFGRNPLLNSVRRLIDDLAGEPPDDLSVRLMPYAQSSADANATHLPSRAAVVSSGVLIDEGRRALVPLSSLSGKSPVWVRDGLGQSSRAQVERHDSPLGLALVRLEKPFALQSPPRALGDTAVPLPLPAWAEKDPFPGSPAYAVEFRPSTSGAPAWPRLSSGFHGLPAAQTGLRGLAIDGPAGPAGGAVFDAAGHCAGLLMPTATARQMIPMSKLRRAFGTLLGPATPLTPGQRATVEAVYEGALRVTLQVIKAR
jgi:exonuclease VII small subunit